ncbi:MAG: hypothetical protein ACR2FM_03150 [Candidatus Saccharimonadales bacterium]
MDFEPLQCADKLRFASSKEATASATVAEHQRGIKLKAYRCRHCDWWHLASV